MMTDNTDERLARIETMLLHITDKIDGRIASSDQWRSRIERIVFGDGNGTPGHHVKLDRLVQAQERQKWLVRTLVAAVGALVAQAALGGLG